MSHTLPGARHTIVVGVGDVDPGVTAINRVLDLAQAVSMSATVHEAKGFDPAWGEEPVIIVTVVALPPRVMLFAEQLRTLFKQEAVLVILPSNCGLILTES